MLSISELKGQRFSSSNSKLELLILDLARNLAILGKTNTQTSVSNEIISILAQKRNKMMSFFSSGCLGSKEHGFAVLTKINEGKIKIN